MATQPRKRRATRQGQGSATPVADNTPAPPNEPISTRRMAPFYWRRWCFAASALFNVLFAVFYIAGVRLTYAPAPISHAAVPLIGRVVQVLFWTGVGTATLADVAIACGLLRAHYRRLLDTAVAGTIFPWAFLALLEVLYSLRIGAGYSEPLSLLLLVAYQALTILSAYAVEPLSTLAILERWRMPALLPLPTQMAQWRRAAQAFTQTLRDGADGADGADGDTRADESG